MKLQEAIEKCFEDGSYPILKKQLAPPELLKAAALECFLNRRNFEVENMIRAGLIFLKSTGLMPKDE